MAEPYYQDEWVTLYHGDCLEVTEWLTADVLVTDPPYGVRKDQKFGAFTGPRSQRGARRDVIIHDTTVDARDNALAAWDQYWPGRPAVIFGSWRMPRPDGIRQLLIWNKEGSYTGGANCAFFTNHEEIYIIGNGEWRKSVPPLRSVLTTFETRHHAPAKAGGHPTPKPIQLMSILLDRCPPGVVADPFAGSGSTLVAAKSLGRRAVGVELEEHWCEVAANRLAQDVLEFNYG